MAKRYDPVLGTWIHGLPDDAPEFGPVSDEPIRITLDGSWQDGYIRADDGVSFTVTDETHEWRDIYSSTPRHARTGRIFVQHHTAQPRNPFWSGEGSDEPIACRLCMAPRGGCTHTGWIPDETWDAAIVDEEPIRIPPVERAGPAMIGDGVLRGQVTGIGWPKVLEKLAAIDDALPQLAKLHAPSVELNSRGKLCQPECQHCVTNSGFREDWPCESATILLRRIGLTERDLDYQLGDAGDGAEGGVQGA